MSKLIRSNGKRLEVYDLGEPIMVFTAPPGTALKHNGYHILSEDAARDVIRDVLRAGIYIKEKAGISS